MTRWAKRPEGSNWGDFGEDDQIGRLNLITPERRRAAGEEIREGLAFPLSLPMSYPMGEYENGLRRPPRLAATPLGYNSLVTTETVDVVSDDAATIALQYSSQWDSFAHHGALFDLNGTGEPVLCYYNGYRAGVDVIGGPVSEHPPHADALGIERLSQTGIQGRGVMVDIERLVGSDHVAVGYDLLMTAMERQDVVVEPGDILCVHTGLSPIILERGKDLTLDELHRSGGYLDGNDAGLRQWITDSGIAALVADNIAVERFVPMESLPTGTTTMLPLHNHCLFRQGIPLGELWHLSELNSWLRLHDRSRFLLTAPPLNLPGAVGSPIAAVATV